MGKGFFVQINSLDERFDKLAYIRSIQGDHSPLFGNRCQPDVEIRPVRLQVIFHVRHDPRRAACGCRDMETVIGQTANDTIIENVAVFAQHQPIAAAPDAKLGPRVGIDTVQELSGIGPDDFDLAQCGGIRNADGRSRGFAFAGDCRLHIFAVLRKIPGPAPKAHGFKDRALPFRPTVDRAFACHIEQIAPAAPCKGAERGGCVGGAKRRQSDFDDGTAKRFGSNRQFAHVRRLALISGHASGGVALDVLNRMKALTHGQANVLGRHVVLIIDERLGACRIGGGRQFID
ncbi:hypothetical protein MnTg02_03353 [bacterium MnTg02]|nr:hypothetical protein MnTg02_03353 [bacterium MnTg02]